jgi:hypothetical protein
MKAFKRGAYKYGEIEEVKGTSCNNTLNVSGEEGIYEVDIEIGTEIGSTGVRYKSFSIPDRFQLFFDGELVADSKFVGDVDVYRDELVGIKNKELPVYEYNGTSFIDNGKLETISISNSDIANGTPSEPTSGSGVLRFDKSKTTVTTMKLRVTGVIGSTLWSASPVCPEAEVPEMDNSLPPRHITYDFMYHRYLRNSACSELENGVMGQYYSTGNLSVGTQFYKDKQLLVPMSSGYFFLGRTIYEIIKGKIIDIYPCHKFIGR